MTDEDNRKGSVMLPALTRLMHGLNAIAILILIPTGWAIYNAAPFFPFSFPKWLVLELYLTEALRWHFAFAWLFVVNGLLMLIVRGGVRRGGPALLPVSPEGLKSDVVATLKLAMPHRHGAYNQPQRLAYLVAFVLMVLVTLSGLALWKPVQLHMIADLLGGYESARRVHFAAMAGLCAFIIVHLTMVLLVPRTLLTVLFGLSFRRPIRSADQ
jgi:thiosulfate reductase cytochrome b subunit